MTGQVLALRDWLVGERVMVAAMEATSDYWKPVFYLLEDATDCWLLNAHNLKAVPGRKTASSCVWPEDDGRRGHFPLALGHRSLLYELVAELGLSAEVR